MKTRYLWLPVIAALLVWGCSEQSASNPTATETAAETALFGGPGGGPHRLFAALDLTDEQRAKIEAVFESHADEHQAMREARQNGATREAMKEQRDALRTKVHAEIEAILTDAQKARLEELRAEREAKGFGPHGKNWRDMSDADRAQMLDKRIARMTETLGLSPDQQEQIRALFEEREQIRLAHQDDRPDEATRQQLRAEHRAELEAILTPEQIEKLKTLHPMRDQKGDRKGHRRGWGS